MRTGLAALLVVLWISPTRADGPKDNIPAQVRRVPKPGIEVSPEDRKDLEAGLSLLKGAADRLEQGKDDRVLRLLPDVRIFEKAVHDALTYQEFLTPEDVARAKELLEEGDRRAAELQRGSASWDSATGLVVRGYVSKIDGSVQPYGLVVPESYTPKGNSRYRLDLWFHGRNEALTEVNFLDERSRRPGEFTPRDAIVLHPYGRYCNAFKFAGEVDVLEAIDDVRSRYKIDDDRTCVRGFSMGGAACWQFAVHYSDRWFAAAPGAGFAETPRFLEFFQKETLNPYWFEKTLWRLYDCTGYALNLSGCPTVAYSGELDIQKQAADVMAEALKAEKIELVHIIGPGTQHSYHPAARREVNRRIDALAVRGRSSDDPSIALTTYTLKYNRMKWLTIDALDEHWELAKVKAAVDGGAVVVRTKNVSALTIDMPPGFAPLRPAEFVSIRIDGKTLSGPPIGSDRSWRCELHRSGGAWKIGPKPDEGLRKRHDLQGPIDDAFMDSFIFVRPTGKPTHEKVGKWVDQELTRAVDRWRRQFRGDARVKDDSAITDEDVASANLVLWGDPESNAVLKRIAQKLPIRWDKETIRVGADRSFPAEDHAPILIYPNPLNPRRYVVLNSGFTYREYDDLNNARQTPKLPDWAVIDLDTPPDSRLPGKVADAGFFGEGWELKPSHP